MLVLFPYLHMCGLHLLLHATHPTIYYLHTHIYDPHILNVSLSVPWVSISALLSAWKTARQSRSTAFLNADVNLEQFGFDPKSLQLAEGRQYVALELARACGIPAPKPTKCHNEADGSYVRMICE